jgi:putative serine protease PepD
MQQLNEHDLSTRSAVPAIPSSPAGTQPGQPARRIRTAAIVALIALLAVVFSTGLFAGWVFGTHSSGTVQPGSTPGTTTPSVAISGNGIEAQREATIARVRPTVVQVNVATSSGEGLGSGVILDSRGYLVTNRAPRASR